MNILSPKTKALEILPPPPNQVTELLSPLKLLQRFQYFTDNISLNKSA
jgi:hypothetical protein